MRRIRLTQQNWPSWWNWELELSPHLLRRMVDRRFNEIDLRRMMEHANAYSPDVVEGRWAIRARHRRRQWEVIIEPDHEQQILVVITAYPVEEL